MKHQTLLIKRSIEKDGLPKDGEYHHTDDGYLRYSGIADCWVNKNMGKGNPTYYLQELPFHQLIDELMPTEEEIQKEIDKLPYTKHLDDGMYNDGKIDGFTEGINWFKTQLLK